MVTKLNNTLNIYLLALLFLIWHDYHIVKMDSTEIKENLVFKIKAQTKRLQNTIQSMDDQRTETSIRLSNSLFGLEINKVHQVIGDQSSIIDQFKVNHFVNELETFLEKIRQNEKVNEIICERNVLNAELEELNNCILIATQKKEDMSQQLTDMKMELDVLDHILYCNDGVDKAQLV